MQNHLFQLLALVAMEPPLNMAANSIQAEKSKLLRSVRLIEPEDVVRGQYTHGVVAGNEVPGYREEDGVAADSQTETYAAMRVRIDSWRWGGTTFLLRTGKRLNKRETRIVVVFRDAPHNFFVTTEVERLVSQKVNIRIQPDEGMSLTFVAKQPGPVVRTQPVLMNFDYGQSFKTSPPEAYERLLLDAHGRRPHPLHQRERDRAGLGDPPAGAGEPAAGGALRRREHRTARGGAPGRSPPLARPGGLTGRGVSAARGRRRARPTPPRSCSATPRTTRPPRRRCGPPP